MYDGSVFGSRFFGSSGRAPATAMETTAFLRQVSHKTYKWCYNREKSIAGPHRASGKPSDERSEYHKV